MNIDKLQEAIEQKAENQINAELEEANKDFNKFIDDHPILAGVSIRLTSENGNTSVPFLRQLFSCEALKHKVFEHKRRSYVVREINKMLKTD